MFWFLLDQHHRPLSGVYFLDPILGPVSGPPFWGPLSGTPFRSPQWIQKTKKMFCVANIFGSKEAENHIYCADLMVALKRICRVTGFCGKNDPHFGVLKAHVFQAMKWSTLSCRDSASSLLIKTQFSKRDKRAGTDDFTSYSLSLRRLAQWRSSGVVE